MDRLIANSEKDELAPPKISVVTAVFNGAATIRNTIQSVQLQSYRNIEYIVVDGGSTDDTVSMVRNSERVDCWVSRPDRGLYDALNEGIRLSSGDLIGVLHADDRLADSSVLARIAAHWLESQTDAVLCNVAFTDSRGRVVREFSAEGFRPEWFSWGMMPPHTGFYAKRSLFSKFGDYSLRWRIAADFELMMRYLMLNQISYTKLPYTVVLMSTGGMSTRSWRSNVQINREIRDACRIHNVPTSYAKIYMKYFRKIWQYSAPLLSRSRAPGR